MFTDKKNILGNIQAHQPLVLDLGCGPLKKNPAWTGIDLLDSDGVDIVGDVYEVIAAFPDKSVDEIHSSHFFEHVADIPGLLKSLERILKPGGIIEIVVPHFSNPYFYSDHTHKSFFGLYSFSYLVKDELLKRKVPDYGINKNLSLQKVYLRFSSAFYISKPLRKCCQLLFNSSTLMKEWYEDSWSRSIPCYEIRFIMIKQDC